MGRYDFHFEADLTWGRFDLRPIWIGADLTGADLTGADLTWGRFDWKSLLYIAMKPKDNIVYEYEVQEKLAQTNWVCLQEINTTLTSYEDNLQSSR